MVDNNNPARGVVASMGQIGLVSKAERGVVEQPDTLPEGLLKLKGILRNAANNLGIDLSLPVSEIARAQVVTVNRSLASNGPGYSPV